jgi:hypothetical protein
MKKDLFIGAAAIATGAVALTVSLLVNNGALNGLNKDSSQSQTATEAQGGEETAYSPSTYWRKKTQETTRLAAPIVGMTRVEAEEFCKENGLILRVLDDGPVTLEFRFSRVNVTLVENVVDHYSIG